MLKTISFVEKLPFRPYLLCSKPVKPGHYSVLPSHILRVLLGKDLFPYLKVPLDVRGLGMAVGGEGYNS